MEKLIILKIGGSVITKKSESLLEVESGNLDRLSREIAEAKAKLKCRMVVVHGAGPFGHMYAEKYNLTAGMKGPESIKGACETHASMESLNARVVDALCRAGLNAIAFQPSAGGIMEDRKLVYFSAEAVGDLLAFDFMPVSYGDVLLDIKTGINILSGDHLVAYLAVKLNASRIVIATDVSGIYDGDPTNNPEALLVKEITAQNVGKLAISGSRGVDVTGGMKRKVNELLDVADRGIKSQVVSGLVPGELKAALLGDQKLGTTIW
ncbi:MAG: isopentenyl phosphate kinase [Candidatus Altiarchaeota archaeon]|nr:isopentenyl phosphate kinase [Candidatus Altiarchaeota archaeon]